jgi:hypothetical protein
MDVPKLVHLMTRVHRPVLLAYGLTIAVVLAIIFGFRFHRETGLTSLIRFGELRGDKLAPELAGIPVHLVPKHHGYDGQYYAHFALHPPWIYHDLDDHFDFPSYRARRVFLPAAAYVLGLGKPAWIVHIFPFLNVAAWLAMAWLLTAWLPPVSWMNFGRWSGCLLAAGCLESIRAALTDLPGVFLTIAALRLYETRRPNAAAGVFAASILTRETLAISALGVFWPPDFRLRQLARTAAIGLAMILPVVLWSLYVAHHFRNNGGAKGNFDWPFMALAGGLADAWRQMAGGEQDNGRYLFRFVTAFSMAVQLGAVLACRERGWIWFRFALGFVLLFPFLGPAVWEGPWAIWRAVLPVTIAFCFLLPPGRWFWPLLLAGSLPTLHALFRLAF